MILDLLFKVSRNTDVNRTAKTMNDLKFFLIFGLTAILTVSCASIHSADVNRGNTGSNNLTVGVVQKEIKIGR